MSELEGRSLFVSLFVFFLFVLEGPILNPIIQWINNQQWQSKTQLYL